jgi:hypothetical protein
MAKRFDKWIARSMDHYNTIAHNSSTECNVVDNSGAE